MLLEKQQTLKKHNHQKRKNHYHDQLRKHRETKKKAHLAKANKNKYKIFPARSANLRK